MLRRSRAIFLAFLVTVSGLVVTAAPAQALPLMIKVTITRVAECCPGGPIDTIGDADFYGRIFIDGQRTDFPEIEDQSLIEPNWQAMNTVDHTHASANVVIQIFDSDGFLNFNDNQQDLTSGDGDRSVDLTVDLHSPDRDCQFSGDVTGSCNQVVSTHGDADDGDVSDVSFKIEVTAPSTAPQRHVSCLHAPLWPQANEPITITANSFGDQPDGQALPPLLADRIEVWFSTDGGVTKQITASSGRQTTLTANQVAGAGGSTFSYGCRVVNGGEPIYSGWRTVQVGDPPQGRAIPVLLNTDKEKALDIVLFPATANVRRAPFNPLDMNLLNYPVYANARDRAFLTQAGDVVAELYTEQLVLDNQRALNIWISPDGAATGGSRDLLVPDSPADADTMPDLAADTNGDGIPDGDGVVDTCQHVMPPNVNTDYGFANVQAILHPATPPPGNVGTLRECAQGKPFSAEATEGRVFIHETGHAAFELADEYAPDGGYFQTPVNPNVYNSLGACQDDVDSLGGVDADCRGMDSVRDPDTAPDFWVSDPSSNDLMNDNRVARRADKRRIAYVFGLCNQTPGKC